MVGRTLWGEPEQVHVQNMEQLHAHDRYQNVTGNKTWSGHSSYMKHAEVEFTQIVSGSG